MKQKQRCMYLDLLKVIAMLCVCIYHFPAVGVAFSESMPVSVLVNRFFWGMNSVCVPLFMMVNGALLMNGRFDVKKHAVRWLKMVVGVYVWFLITLFAAHLYRNGAGYVAENAFSMVSAALFLYGYDGITMNHLWFIQMLIALYIFVPLIKAAFDIADRNMHRALWFVCAALVFFCFLTHDFEHVNAYLPVLRRVDLGGLVTMNPARNSTYGAMIVYFILGGLMHRNLERLRSAKLWQCALAFFAGAAVLFAEWLLMTRRNEAVYDIVYYGYNCLPTLVMSASLFAGAAALEARAGKWLAHIAPFTRLIGENTLTIYYLHWLLGLTVFAHFSLPGGPVVRLALIFAMMAACALAGRLLRRVPLMRHLV